jgi:hypothetical protein
MKKNHLLIIISYLIVLGIVFVLISYITGNNYFQEKNFLNWDSQHYFKISEKGYENYLAAFFPLFPMIWKITSLSIIGMIILNCLIYLVSFLLLAKELDLNNRELLLFLSVPQVIFYFLPYSEAVFFCASTVLILGLIRKNQWLVVSGLFFGTLARPAFAIFVPAMVITEFLTSKADRRMFYRLLVDLMSILLAAFVVALIQYSYTGDWFRFFAAQRLWDNYLQIPRLPFTSWAGGLIVRVDGTAFLAGFISGVVLVMMIIRYFRNRSLNIPRELVFSLSYLSGISLLVLLFRGGSMFSLNRFVFATPFFIIALFQFLRMTRIFAWKDEVFMFIFLAVFWLLFGSYGHIQTFLIFVVLSCYILLYSFMKTKWSWMQWTATILVIVTNLTFQVYFYIRFLDNLWVG